MKKAVVTLLSELHGRLIGYVTVMSYGYCQICIKADASSLLGFEEEVDGKVMRIEDIAVVGVHDEPDDNDKLDLYPKNPDHLGVLMKGMMKIHPELKQSLEKYKDSDENDDSIEAKYLRLTMPEVNTERRDVVNAAIDALDAECKLRLDTMKSNYITKITSTLVNEAPDELDEAKAQVDQLVEEANQMRENMTNEKKQEVEQAYQRHLANVGQKEEGKGGGFMNKVGQTLNVSE